MNDGEDESGERSQFLNLFAFVQARRQMQSSYESETEYLIAHYRV